MIVVLIIVIALIAWSLHLMQEAVEQREFSLMLAGFLVAVAAAAMVAVYILMGHYVGYMSRMETYRCLSPDAACRSLTWALPIEEVQDPWPQASVYQYQPYQQ